jgi:hypothetical protein
MRLSYCEAKKPIRSSIFIVLSSIVILSLYGASEGQDISRIKQDGTECKFRARIIEKTDAKAMVVTKTPTTEDKEKRILVLATRDTKIGYQIHGSSPRWQYVAFNDLKEETHVLIKGFKVVEQEGDHEYIVVLATQIEYSE